MQEYLSDIDIAPDAVEALRCAAEGNLVGLFEEAALIAVHAKRQEVEYRDLQLARRVRGERT